MDDWLVWLLLLLVSCLFSVMFAYLLIVGW